MERIGRITTEKHNLSEIDLSNPNLADFINRLEKSRDELLRPISKNKAHGRRRPQREIGDIRSRRPGEIYRNQEVITLLKSGKDEDVIFYKKSDGKIVGCTTKD